jgi:hypothetical protein
VPPAKVAPAPPPARAKEAPKAEEKPDPSKRASKPVEKIPPAAVEKKAPESSRAQAEPKGGSAAGGSGSILVTVRPWGEIYVDGQRRGESPPLYEVRLSAGKHRVEIRHPEFPPHVRTVDVGNGARVDVRHVFLPRAQPSPLRKFPWN